MILINPITYRKISSSATKYSNHPSIVWKCCAPNFKYKQKKLSTKASYLRIVSDAYSVQ